MATGIYSNKKAASGGQLLETIHKPNLDHWIKL